MKKPINIAIFGLGTVGTGILKLLQDNFEELKRRVGHDIRVSHVGVRRLHDNLPKDIVQVQDLMALAADPSIDIVVEVMGGTDTAKEVILSAIAHGKHIVTANKALLAQCGNELFAAADQHGVHIAYEASVAGGIPIIKVLREALAANKVDWLAGIINGTGNFILTKMQEEGQDFLPVLKEAQALGYAEADPAFDVEGIDAAHKLSLLASIAFGVPIQFDKVYCEGITKIALQDVRYAKELGYTIKHLGFAVRREAGLELRVHPTLIPSNALLANVNGVKNAVMVNAHPLGQTLYYGDGAGAGATASAVMADVMDLVRLIGSDEGSLVHHLAFVPEALADTPILPSDDIYTAYYLRLCVADEVGVLASATRILSENGIGIEAILQKPNQNGDVFIIILTDPCQEKQMNNAIEYMGKLNPVKEPIIKIRLESLL